MERLKRHIPEGFKKTLIGSVALHIVILLMLVVYKAGGNKVFFTPVYTVNLVEPRGPAPRKKTAKRPAKKRPVKAAPKKKPVTAKTKKPKVLETTKTIKVKQKEKPKEDAVSLSEALKRIKKTVREKEDKRLVAAKLKEIRRRQASKETAPEIEKIKQGLARTAAPEKDGSQGLTPLQSSGLKSSAFEIKHKAYFVAIRDMVQENWGYPEEFHRKGVSVIVSVRIGRTGELLTSWVEKGSGNRQFDLSLLDAVKKAAPFPPLPQDFEGEFLETGLRFCPQCES